jgi:hypothetical protein
MIPVTEDVASHHLPTKRREPVCYHLNLTPAATFRLQLVSASKLATDRKTD